MGDYITFSEGITVTITSMIAVFIVLVLIATLIDGLRIISGDGKKKDNKISTEDINAPQTLKVAEDSDVITEELVAVIAAAIATNLGLNVPDINIRTIKRIPQMTSAWSNVGNIKQTSGRL
jgi:sodium pump decarboxylase gamma subunit